MFAPGNGRGAVPFDAADGTGGLEAAVDERELGVCAGETWRWIRVEVADGMEGRADDDVDQRAGAAGARTGL